ncbi:hypothetical protein BEWA_033590 [Theileria equi strain WA]|uniref:Uncharacterized protein n=1 Tax=Theileria equi strain WA TaxID=1537102 RepID=L0B053_THEEQ|nr:hypothetical protein BEWA_033590 [Theileria equi strain WA]
MDTNVNYIKSKSGYAGRVKARKQAPCRR